jgi:hypothetical protein
MCKCISATLITSICLLGMLGSNNSRRSDLLWALVEVIYLICRCSLLHMRPRWLFLNKQAKSSFNFLSAHCLSRVEFQLIKTGSRRDFNFPLSRAGGLTHAGIAHKSSLLLLLVVIINFFAGCIWTTATASRKKLALEQGIIWSGKSVK